MVCVRCIGPGTPTSTGAAINGPISGISSNLPAGSSGAAVANIQPPSGPSAGGAAMTSIGSSATTAATVPAPAGNAGTQTRSQQIYQQVYGHSFNQHTHSASASLLKLLEQQFSAALLCPWLLLVHLFCTKLRGGAAQDAL